MTAQRPIGFGDIQQTAAFFGLSEDEVAHKADSGEWACYRVDGKRVFHIDAVIEGLARRSLQSEATPDA